MMQITIRTDANPSTWGDFVTEETAEKAAEELAMRLEAFAEREWPEAEVYATTTRRPCGDMTDVAEVRASEGEYIEHEDAREVRLAIRGEQERIWVEVLAEFATDDDV